MQIYAYALFDLYKYLSAVTVRTMRLKNKVVFPEFGDGSSIVRLILAVNW